MTEIMVDLQSAKGTIKRLHGVNNGPIGYGSLVDVSHYYSKAEIPLVRLHDPNWPHPREIDIHTIFPNLSKDPADPANYDFAKSDTYIRKILDTGARILWRLGESIEHTARKYYVHPPADYRKWTEVCLGIIRHYNQGWADGYHYGIEYWEIWNEPDVGRGLMWSGTTEQYYELYRAAAPAIKALDPGLKVGGYAAASVRAEPEFFQGFLRMCREENLPLDFFSWHTYSAAPSSIKELSFHVREELDRYGFTAAESIFNEWNLFDADWNAIWEPGNEHYRRDMFERGKGEEGASFAAAVLMQLQDCPVEAANYYDGQPNALFCGLFDYYGVPQKTYYAFEAFNELARHPERLEVRIQTPDSGLYACAGRNDRRETAVLVSNYSGRSGYCEVSLQGIEAGGEWLAEEYRLDADRNLQLADRFPLTSGCCRLFVKRHGVILLKIKPKAL